MQNYPMSKIEKLHFLSEKEIEHVAVRWGTPVFVYDEQLLIDQANAALGFEAPYGLTVRYAMKANPNAAVIKTLTQKGIHIDASSGYEAERAMRAGIEPEKILLTSQQLPENLADLVDKGMLFNACSLHQLEQYGKQLPGTSVSVRINPGQGSGHSNKTNVGGPASSFGIWHEYIDKVLALAKKYNLTINRLHTHIGSGSDPEVWTRVAAMSLEQVKQFPDVEVLNLGGGFKVARMADEVGTDLKVVGPVVADAFRKFKDETGRKLRLEIEPGTYLVANAGAIVTTVHDIVDTGEDGYAFLKIDSGMTDLLRPSLYGAQHPLIVVNDLTDQHEKYVVVGHCCESGDLLTPQPGDPDTIAARLLRRARIGDRLVIEGAGAYAAAMATLHYNSFPVTPQVMRKTDGEFVEISRRGSIEDTIRLER